MKIGTFTRDEDGLINGKIYGLGLGSVPVMFEPQTSKENREYFRLIADPIKDAYEIGVAFPKEKSGMIYYSVNIESPVLPAPINAALFPDKENTGQHNLVWNRPEQQGLKAEATLSVGGKTNHTKRYPSPRVN